MLKLLKLLGRTKRAQEASAERARYDGRFRHAMPHGVPDVSCRTSDAPRPEPDVVLVERLMVAFDRAMADEAEITRRPSGDVWEALGNTYHSEFLALLRAGNAKAIAEHLVDYHLKDISLGLSEGDKGHRNLGVGADAETRLGALYLDKLASLSEALGVLPVEHPEQGRWGQNMYVAADEQLDLVETRLGIDSAPPHVFAGAFGLHSARRRTVYKLRDIMALYTASRLADLSSQAESREVCEIGGGYGTMAYYATRLGVGPYTLIDLPYMNLISGYYLIKALPSMTVSLYGEDNVEGAGIRILPYWVFGELPDCSFELMFNQDSFPEIDERTVLAYLKQIPRKARRYFLSINHEGAAKTAGSGKPQIVVPSLIEASEGYERVYRCPFWMRQGYVEELYRLNECAAARDAH